MKKSIKMHCCKAVMTVAKKVAERDANTNCVFWGYQPKMPKDVAKLRKF